VTGEVEDTEVPVGDDPLRAVHHAWGTTNWGLVLNPAATEGRRWNGWSFEPRKNWFLSPSGAPARAPAARPPSRPSPKTTQTLLTTQLTTPPKRPL